MTICARNTSTGIGWRRRDEKVTTKYKDVLRHQCGQAKNVTACIERETFNLTEVVGDISMGDTDMMNPDFWSSDFSWTMEGICYTLHYPKPVKDEYNDDQIIIRSILSSTFQVIFIHDRNFFVNNYNPKSSPMTRRKVVNGDSYTLMITLVEHQLLNRPSEPCVEDLDYSFQACVKESFSSRFSMYSLPVLKFFLSNIF